MCVSRIRCIMCHCPRLQRCINILLSVLIFFTRSLTIPNSVKKICHSKFFLLTPIGIDAIQDNYNYLSYYWHVTNFCYLFYEHFLANMYWKALKWLMSNFDHVLCVNRLWKSEKSIYTIARSYWKTTLQ